MTQFVAPGAEGLLANGADEWSYLNGVSFRVLEPGHPRRLATVYGTAMASSLGSHREPARIKRRLDRRSANGADVNRLNHAAGLVCVITALSGCGPRGAAQKYDLGYVEPGTYLRPTVELSNPFHSPALIGGIDAACGVRVVNMKNGVIGPDERLTLRLVSRAQRVAGPGGFVLNVAVTAGKRSVTRRYAFNYVVKSHPFLDRSDAWITPSAPARVNAFGSDGSS